MITEGYPENQSLGFLISTNQYNVLFQPHRSIERKISYEIRHLRALYDVF
jgi:hypothetical protein